MKKSFQKKATSFQGKVVIVTGASSGIGKACARAFFKAGAHVVLAARSTHKLHALEAQLLGTTTMSPTQVPDTTTSVPDSVPPLTTAASNSVPLANAAAQNSVPLANAAAQNSVPLTNAAAPGGTRSVLSIAADVTRESDCKHLIETTLEHFGQLDVLVCNAGLSMRALFKDLDLSVLKELMDVNFWGCVYCTKYALPALLESKGSLVGVTSIAGFKGLPARTGYSASKFALNGFLDTLRTEHLYDGLHVMTFAPGFTSSNVRVAALTANGRPQGKTPRQEEKMMSADRVAYHMLKGIRQRKNQVVLTPLGKVTVWASKFFPRLVTRLEYKIMAQEPDSPLRSHHT